IENNQFVSSGKNGLIGLLNKIQSIAIAMIKPRSPNLRSGHGFDPSIIYKSFVRLYKPKPLRVLPPCFRSYPNFVKQFWTAFHIITKHMKAIVPLWIFYYHMDIRINGPCWFYENG